MSETQSESDVFSKEETIREIQDFFLEKFKPFIDEKYHPGLTVTLEVGKKDKFLLPAVVRAIRPTLHHHQDGFSKTIWPGFDGVDFEEEEEGAPLSSSNLGYCILQNHPDFWRYLTLKNPEQEKASWVCIDENYQPNESHVRAFNHRLQYNEAWRETDRVKQNVVTVTQECLRAAYQQPVVLLQSHYRDMLSYETCDNCGSAKLVNRSGITTDFIDTIGNYETFIEKFEVSWILPESDSSGIPDPTTPPLIVIKAKDELLGGCFSEWLDKFCEVLSSNQLSSQQRSAVTKTIHDLFTSSENIEISTKFLTENILENYGVGQDAMDTFLGNLSNTMGENYPPVLSKSLLGSLRVLQKNSNEEIEKAIIGFRILIQGTQAMAMASLGWPLGTDDAFETREGGISGFEDTGCLQTIENVFGAAKEY
jgi:hypothetical protein